MFRCDSLKDDPAQIKYNLSEFGNRTLVDLWLTKGCPTNIQIVKPALECKGEVMVSRFGSPSQKGYDGIQMRGRLAVQHYRRSVIDVCLDIMPKFNQRPATKIASPKARSNYYQAQPQHVNICTQKREQYTGPTTQQYTQTTTATGANRISLGGELLQIY